MPNQSPQERKSQGGDVTKAEKLVAPPVVPTNPDTVNQHGPGEWDNNVYGGNPYKG